MSKTSIIIPVCGNEKMTQECLESIEKNTTDYEIIIIDNGSTPPFTGQYKVIRNSENFGFTKAVNQGLYKATGDVIVILNNDTIVTPHWLECLKFHLEKYDMVGPVTNRISGPQQIAFPSDTHSLRVDSFAEWLHQKNCGLTIDHHRLVFFCVAFKKSVVEKIGFLDEQFSPGNFEDDDYCLRAIEAGLRLGIAQDVFIYHHGSQTHLSLGLDHAGLLKTNAAKFEAKWPLARQLELRQMSLLTDLPAGDKKKPTPALGIIALNEEKGPENCIISCKDFVSVSLSILLL